MGDMTAKEIAIINDIKAKVIEEFVGTQAGTEEIRKRIAELLDEAGIEAGKMGMPWVRRADGSVVA